MTVEEYNNSVDNYSDGIYRFILRNIKNRDTARDIVQDSYEKLWKIQRSVILLRDYEGYSYEEIGDITGLSESQVKVYIYRGRVFLKNYIGKLEYII